MMRQSFTFCVPCLFGLEGLAADELRRLDLAEVRAEDGRVDGAPWAWYAERIEAAWKRERARLMAESRSWEECIKRAEESWDDVY